MGKGDRARNCYTEAFEEGYGAIDWGNKNRKRDIKVEKVKKAVKQKKPRENREDA